MIQFKIIVKVLPWLIALVLGGVLYLNMKQAEGPRETITNTSILQKVEALGKMELVKYNFKEITKLNQSLAEIAGIKFFESNIVLISKGEAVGCIDLTKVKPADISLMGDTVFVTLPKPELCYYKLDLANTEIFSMSTATFSDDRDFIEKAYEVAEEEIKKAALNSGILEQAEENAQLILKPLLSEISGKHVVLRFRIAPQQLDAPE